MKKTKLLIALCFAGCMAKAQIIYTVAGTGGTGGTSGNGGFAASALLGRTPGVAKDANGNIYISDYYDNLIRKISPNGIITAFAGTGTAGFSGDGGQASAAELYHPWGLMVDGSGNLYICDNLNNRVRMVNTSGIITTIAGNGTAATGGDGGQATAAEVNGPNNVMFDSNGNLFITTSSPVVRKVNTSGIISTFAGNGTQGYSGDGGAATAAEIYDPAQLAIDGSNNVYFADAGNSTVRKVTASNGNISTVAGTGTAGYSGDGGAATAAKINFPCGLAFDGSGNLYIGDTYNYCIRKITSGTISTVAGTGTSGFSGNGVTPTSAEMKRVYMILFNSDGSYYIADGDNYVLREITSVCPANAGPNVINQQDDCGNWPGVQIGTPSVTNMTYSWATCHAGYLNNCAIAQPTSAWTNTTTPKVYTLSVSYSLCTTATSTVQVTAASCVDCGGGCRDAAGITTTNQVASIFVVYPNPANAQITVTLYDKAENIRIIDMQGRTVYETKDTDAGEFNLDVSQYNKGIYFVMAKIGNVLEKQKLVVE